MPGKDDPLGQRATLWLDRESMEVARERYFRAWLAQSGVVADTVSGMAILNKQWEMAWAAAVAVHSFISEGRLGPAGQNVQDVTVTAQASSWAGGWNEDAVDDEAVQP